MASDQVWFDLGQTHAQDHLREDVFCCVWDQCDWDWSALGLVDKVDWRVGRGERSRPTGGI
jgi:hypothetical protein